MQGKDGNNRGNVFPRIVIYEAQTGILMQGVDNSAGPPSAVTWNDFGHVDIGYNAEHGFRQQFLTLEAVEPGLSYQAAYVGGGPCYTQSSRLPEKAGLSVCR